MKILVFGRTGQVARELARRCPIDIEAKFLGREEADLSNPRSCTAAVLAARADAIVNAAAWTEVDRAETEEAAATVVNGEAPGAIARACATMGIPLLHLSTDYVFDGAGIQPFSPLHSPAPLGGYGRSKLAGETAILASGVRHVILRTSWVVSAHGTNFVKTMLRLGKDRSMLRVVADQVGGPTPAASVADAIFTTVRAMAAGHPGGIYHFSGAPDTNWAEFARVIMRAAGLNCEVESIPSCEYFTAARRPLNSRLECSSFEQDFCVTRPDWRVGLACILNDLGAQR